MVANKKVNVTFTKSIALPPNDEETVISFEASVVSGGFSYEFWGQRGFKSETEIDEITFDESGLTKEQINYINRLIEDGNLDDDIWERYNEN